MAGQQRKCANCRFFDDAGMPGNGWCTHPKRQLNSGVKLLVRGGELACRNSWGGDLFQSRMADDDAAPVAAADLPGNDKDDEVTSVTIPVTRTEPAEDRVVRDRPAPRRPDPIDSNDAAHRDQEERARIMARGSRDAVAQARQRYSTRRQPLGQDDVVADDHTAAETTDRIVTRQGRFSDREFAAGLPHLRTAPVPREEVRQRAAQSQDRFDTVPAIDPDFEMPGQHERAESPAAPPHTLEGQPEAESATSTTYEHVLQRARRIRAAKQGRLRPIRHADVLLGRADAAPIEADRQYEPAGQVDAEGWGDELVDANAQLEPEPHAVYADDVATWDDGDEMALDEPADERDQAGAWIEETEEDDDIAASWADEEDDAWADDDPESLYQPEPRRPGWLSRFRIGHRPPEPAYDDAIITRHTDSRPAYFDEAPFEDQSWSHSAPEPVSTRHDAYDDDLPSWRGATSAYQDALPEPAPVPPPVPTSERTGDASGRASMPARPAPSSRPRHYQAGELPDLEDALFDDREDRVVRAERPASKRTLPEGTDTLGSVSARDSFFRASRYPHAETASAFPDDQDLDPRGMEVSLPDLGGDRLDVRDVVARGAELLDRRIEVAPDVPRQCRTCRSFRSADGGTRGWCTNEWAFTHRRMVNDDDLACVSAIGCWWLPADHLRLDLDDDAGDVRTPRMDELIASNAPAARRVSGE